MRIFFSSVASWALLAIFVIALPSVRAQTSVQLGTDSTEFVLNGTMVYPDGVLKGKALIEGDVLEVCCDRLRRPPSATLRS